MARLELFLLGPPRLQRDGVPLRFDTRKIMALVAYVAVSGLETKGRPVSRAALVALLWPDLEPGRAQATLRRDLSLLRKALHGEWLVVDRETVGTDPEADLWLDVDQFARLLHACEAHGHPPGQACTECLDSLGRAVTLYQGDFLQGFGLRDSVEFDDWQFFQAEGLRRQLASALERLARGHGARGSYEAALPHARRWLALDALHEPAHRLLMELYGAAGQRAAALRQYRECARILETELGLAPAAETTALYEQIRTGPAAGRSLPAEPSAVTAPRQRERAARFRHNLPAQVMPCVGREQELAELRSRLQDPGCRLVTLLGPGGIGKTRLALQLAEDLVEAEPAAFEDGVFYVSLAPLQTAQGVEPAVAEALGHSFHAEGHGGTPAPPRRQLLDLLRHKRLFLVMDNYEHLLVEESQPSGSDCATGFLSELLSAAPGVKVLVTSRTGLQIQGEHLYPLAGLRVPEVALPGVPPPGQAARGYSAVELFVLRATQVRPALDWGPQNLAQVAEICRLVQGMPLAILLAAAWVGMLTPHEIAAEIRHSLDFLETDLRDVPPRQRSVRATFDHSWRLLGEREQEILLGLSVFRGSFEREAAREVAGASLHDLKSLVDKSLLLPVADGRYELHALLRQYASERLDRTPDGGEAVRDRHCAHYCAALERWAGKLKDARQQEAAAEMQLGIEDARAAFQWAAAHGQVERLARALDGLWLYHDSRMRYSEAETALRAAVHALEAEGSFGARRLRAKCLVLWSQFQLDLVRKESSIKAVEQALELLRELEAAGQDVRHEMALALFQGARLKTYEPLDHLAAGQLLARSVVLCEEVGDRWGLARALAHLGWVTEELGRLAEARALCQKSLSIRRELGDRRGMADALLYLGIITWLQGDLDDALRLVQESHDLFLGGGDRLSLARSMKSLGELQVRYGRYEDGLAQYRGTLEIFSDLAHPHGFSGVLPFVAEAKVHLGRYGEARVDGLQALARARRDGFRWSIGFSLFVEGMAALGEGSRHEALLLIQESASVLGEIRHRESRGWVLGPLGIAALAAGETALARQCVLEALQTGVELPAFMPVLYGLPAAALLLAEEGELELAVEAYACALRYPFVANSHWFEDLAGRPLAAAAANLPAERAEAARQRGSALEWDAMAARLLAEFRHGCTAEAGGE